MANVLSWDLQLPTDYLKQIVGDLLEERKFKSGSTVCFVQRVIAGPWSSETFRVKVSDSTKTIHLFIKCLPQDVSKRELLGGNLYFKNEVMFYKSVIPAFTQFYKGKLPQESRLAVAVPKCYRAESDGENDTIIMEDLSSRGYVVLKDNKLMELPEVFLSFKELGRLHGLSLAMKIQRPQHFNELKHHLTETTFGQQFYNTVSRNVLNIFFQDFLLHLKQHYEKDHMYLKKFEDWTVTTMDILPKLAQEDPLNEPYNVITHGDPWACNFMFHYQDGSNFPDEVVLLDFQQARYTSPATDVGRLLFVAMDKSTRDENRQDLLNCYYRSMKQTLRDLGSNLEDIFPFSALEDQLSKYSAFFISCSLFNLVYNLNNYEYDDSGITGDNVESVLDSIRGPYQRITHFCFKQMCEVIEECVDRGYM